MSASAVVEWDSTAAARTGREAVWERLRAGATIFDSCPGAAFALSGTAARLHSRPGTSRLFADDVAKVAIAGDWRLDDLPGLAATLGAGPDSSEPALLIAGYARWGEEIAQRLTGDFAILLWDWGNQRCLAFTDPIGVKPIYYATWAGGIGLGTDVSTLVRAIGVRPVPDDRVVVEHLLWEYSSTARTYWADVSRLPGGHLLQSKRDYARVKVRRYWRPSADCLVKSRAEAHEAFRALLVHSVKRRLPDRQPVLAHLSGGLDSSLIVCVAADLIRRASATCDFKTVTQRFPNRPWDEGEYVRAVKRWASVEGPEWDGSRSVPEDLMRPSLGAPDELAPRSSGSMQDLVIANQIGAGIILSGDGGDQLGRPAGVMDDLVRERPIGFALDAALNPAYPLWRRVARLRRVLGAHSPRLVSEAFRHVRYRRALPRWLVDDRKAEALLAMTDAHGTSCGDMEMDFSFHVQGWHWRDLTGARTALSLARQYAAADRHSVEMRYPFLDAQLIEFVLSLPPWLWPAPGPDEPRFHREACFDWLPPAVRERRSKAFFSGAIGERVHAALPEIERLLEGETWLAARYVQRSRMSDLLRRARSFDPVKDWRQRWRVWLEVWSIATLEAWLRAVSIYATSADTYRSRGPDGYP